MRQSGIKFEPDSAGRNASSVESSGNLAGGPLPGKEALAFSP